MNIKIREVGIVVTFSFIVFLAGILLADSLAYVSKVPSKDTFVLISAPGVTTAWIHWNIDIKELIIGAIICIAAGITCLAIVKSHLRFIPIGIMGLFVILGLVGTIDIHQPCFFTDNTELITIDDEGNTRSFNQMRRRYIMEEDLNNPTLFTMPGEKYGGRLVGVKKQWMDH